MSLNFFKKEPKKTDASLSYETVLGDLRDINTALNVDEFIQKENIDLHQHQEFYSNKNTETAPPTALEKGTEYKVDDTRQFANALIETSKTSTSIKNDITAMKEKVNDLSVENKQTMNDITSLPLTNE